MPDLKKFFKKPNSKGKSRQALEVPQGLWIKCPKCQEIVYKEEVKTRAYSCPKCGGYFRMKAGARLRMVIDEGSFIEWDTDLESADPLHYPGYPEKIAQLRTKTRLHEGVRIGEAAIGGIPVVIGVCDARFFMGSMGYVVGEKITRAVEEATRRRLPVVLFCCSGGARMQEGMVSLMQMAKTAAAIGRHQDAGLLYLPILTDPTMGGVTASFAMLGDIILAEPGALIGFAGPRVIAQTIGQKLPEGFQRAEFLVEHGIIDGVLPRERQKETLSWLLAFHQKTVDYTVFPSVLPISAQEAEPEKETGDAPSCWERVQAARSSERPTSLEYITGIFRDFMELHGDRHCRDDRAIVGGIALLDDQPVTVIGIQKGRDTKDNILRNFGMPYPEGYRKALRLMQQAQKFGRPILLLIDTPGAFCGIEAEERGQGEAIARNLLEMAKLTVPILSIVIGEGGSGGALALAVANEVWMLENTSYTILSPEGFASILWKDGKKAPEAAEMMKVTAAELKEMGIIEKVIPENPTASRENLPELCQALKIFIRDFLRRQEGKSPEELAAQRYERFRKF